MDENVRTGVAVSGLADVEQHAAMLERLVTAMDTRIADMHADRDIVALGPAYSLIM